MAAFGVMKWKRYRQLRQAQLLKRSKRNGNFEAAELKLSSLAALPGPGTGLGYCTVYWQYT